ncbi:hypothetical protein HKBW3S43_01087 [Candidatus Hakubella thermalkaliphila]|uniref:Uncharacterized protein n=1 Tax=Candidatus Hakubella thermalkaliphila TaxID=2754717 RepID=A0A6V8PRN0_9ACTN|nr:hypothetical protein [Actinomycetota bacterium]GFP35295.1 hypothetical protein HKBW3S43_01087 [Candidatus Hakubella thermalkaliphila]
MRNYLENEPNIFVGDRRTMTDYYVFPFTSRNRLAISMAAMAAS